jgi:hypothetical protein
MLNNIVSQRSPLVQGGLLRSAEFQSPRQRKKSVKLEPSIVAPSPTQRRSNDYNIDLSLE